MLQLVLGLPLAVSGPTSPSPDCHLRLLGALQSVAHWVTQVRVYDDNGERAPPTNANKAAFPNFLCYGSGYNLTVVCWILQGIQLHRVGLDSHIDILAELMNASNSFTSQCASASKTKTMVPLSAPNRQIDAELRSLFATERPDGGSKLDTLLSTIEKYRAIARDPAAGCALAVRNPEHAAGYGNLEEIGDHGEGKQLAANLRQALLDCRDPWTHDVWPNRMRHITDLVDKIYGTKRLHINRDGVCTLAYKGAATNDVRRFVAGAWTRNQTACEIKAQGEARRLRLGGRRLLAPLRHDGRILRPARRPRLRVPLPLR